jgi:hypothetical protein
VKTFVVKIPLAGHIEFEVQAETPQQAVLEAQE